MPTLHQTERLITAYDAMTRADLAVSAGDLSAEAVRASIRAHNVLADVAIECGMPTDFPSHCEWAATLITQEMVSA